MFKNFATLSQHTRSVVSIKYSPDGKLLASASADKTANIYNSETGELLIALCEHSLGLNECSWVDDNILVTASDDKSIKVWDITTGQVLTTLTGHKSAIYSLSINPTNRLILSGSTDGSVRLFDALSGSSVMSFDAHSDSISSCDFSFSGTEFVTGSHDGLVRVWDSSNIAICKNTFYCDSCPPVSSVRYSPSDDYILVSTLDDTHRLYSNSNPVLNKSSNENLNLIQCVQEYTGHVNKSFSIFSSFYKNYVLGDNLISGSEDNNVYIWNISNKKENNICLKGHTDAVISVACNPNRSLTQVASSSCDNTIKIWNYDHNYLEEKNVLDKIIIEECIESNNVEEMIINQ